MMLDPKLIKEKPEMIRKMLSDRHFQFDLDGFVNADSKRRELIIKTDELRKQKNQVAAEIATKKKSGQNADDVIAKMQTVSQQLQTLEVEQIKIESDYNKLAMTMPNLIHDSVPLGADDTANIQVKTWGTIPKFEFKIKDHIDIAQDLGLVDLERAAKTAGARFYYLKNNLVRLNQALIHFALDYLAEKQYGLIQPPYMINRGSMEGAIIADDFESVIYKVQDEDLFLIGTSEHSIAAMFPAKSASRPSLRSAGRAPLPTLGGRPRGAR